MHSFFVWVRFMILIIYYFYKLNDLKVIWRKSSINNDKSPTIVTFNWICIVYTITQHYVCMPVPKGFIDMYKTLRFAEDLDPSSDVSCCLFPGSLKHRRTACKRTKCRSRSRRTRTGSTTGRRAPGATPCAWSRTARPTASTDMASSTLTSTSPRLVLLP